MFIIALTILRLIIFCLIWIITLGKHHLWLFPNLTEDVGFFASFWPLYKVLYKINYLLFLILNVTIFVLQYEYKGNEETETSNKKKKKKKEKYSDNEDENEDKIINQPLPSPVENQDSSETQRY